MLPLSVELLNIPINRATYADPLDPGDPAHSIDVPLPSSCTHAVEVASNRRCRQIASAFSGASCFYGGKRVFCPLARNMQMRQSALTSYSLLRFVWVDLQYPNELFTLRHFGRIFPPGRRTQLRASAFFQLDCPMNSSTDSIVGSVSRFPTA